MTDYRKWLDARGGNGPFGPIPKVAMMRKEELVDRKSLHTDHCSVCSVVRAQNTFPAHACLIASCGRACWLTSSATAVPPWRIT